MSCYVENHLRIWGKDAKAFMKAATGEEMSRGTKYPVAFDPDSIRPAPQELMEIDPSVGLTEAKKKALSKKYGHDNWAEWREANWTVHYIFNSDANWSHLDKQIGSHPMVPFTKNESKRRLVQYPGQVWYVYYWSPWMPPYKLLQYIGQTWDIQLENFFDSDELSYCGVYGSEETRPGNFVIKHLLKGTGGYNEISYDKYKEEGLDAWDMPVEALPADTWKQIDEIKKAVYGLCDYEEKVSAGEDCLEDPEEYPKGETDQWLDFENRRKRSLQNGKGK